MFADRLVQQRNLHEMTYYIHVQHLLASIGHNVLEGLRRFRSDFEVWRLLETKLEMRQAKVSQLNAAMSSLSTIGGIP